jgi:hypothetical protein
MTRKISQAQARRYRKERDEAFEKLNALVRSGTRTYAGTDLCTWGPFKEELRAIIGTAKKLNHAVFVNVEGESLNFRALPRP